MPRLFLAPVFWNPLSVLLVTEVDPAGEEVVDEPVQVVSQEPQSIGDNPVFVSTPKEAIVEAYVPSTSVVLNDKLVSTQVSLAGFN